MTHESLGPKTGTYEPPSISRFPEMPKVITFEENKFNKLKALFEKLIYAYEIGNTADVETIIAHYRKNS